MVFDLLTLEDKQKILSYRDEFAYVSGHRSACGIETLLSPWNNAKSEYLEKLFGNKLIITRPIEFKEGYQDIRNHMEELLYYDTRAWSFIEKIQDVYRERARRCNWDAPEYREKEFVCNLLLSTWTLSENKIKGEDSYYFPEDKKFFELTIGDNIYKVQIGMKPMRVITKIANAYNIGLTPDEEGVTDLEYFRRRHSLGLNQKVLKGDLCLSIHPLDYMTMSDNEEGWESCMSWVNDGEYKQGTVEMMNSPCVVVGYLASKSNKLCWSDEEWNSKKWRSLFIVDKDFIINVRSYPYDNDNLVKAAISELAEMSGWGRMADIPKYEYLEKYEEHRKTKTPVVINDRKIAIDFCTQAMYNDFGWGHYIALNPNSSEDIIDYHYCYSGLSECMWCGSVDSSKIGNGHDPCALCCTDCYNMSRCQWCEDRYSTDELYTTADGTKLCEYCWDQHTTEDQVSNLYYCSDNDDLLVILLSNNRTKFSQNTGWLKTIDIHKDSIGTENWTKYFKIAEPRETEIPYKYGDTETIKYVLVDDCTTEGLELFTLYDEDDVKDYLGEDEDN